MGLPAPWHALEVFIGTLTGFSLIRGTFATRQALVKSQTGNGQGCYQRISGHGKVTPDFLGKPLDIIGTISVMFCLSDGAASRTGQPVGQADTCKGDAARPERLILENYIATGANGRPITLPHSGR
jgi:hypothetical protein